MIIPLDVRAVITEVIGGSFSFVQRSSPVTAIHIWPAESLACSMLDECMGYSSISMEGSSFGRELASRRAVRALPLLMRGMFGTVMTAKMGRFRGRSPEYCGIWMP